MDVYNLIERSRKRVKEPNADIKPLKRMNENVEIRTSVYGSSHGRNVNVVSYFFCYRMAKLF